MGTQWNTGMAGLTGMRYETLPTVLRLLNVPRAEWGEIFKGLRVMEREVMDQSRSR